jgi:hemerythrin-like domain-containing protein
MKAIEILVQEHDLIRKYLENLSLAVSRLEAGQALPREFFEKVVEFARLFTDRYHHFKEEHVMFALLARKKGGVLDAQMDALRYQHERGRNFIVEISEALDGYTQGRVIPASRLLENLAAFLSLLRQHIHREDHIFYPMVEQEISEEEHGLLLEEFARAEERAGAGAFEKSRGLVQEMGAILAV